MKYYYQLLSVPLFFLVLYFSLNVIWNVFDLPPVDELMGIVSEWFDRYGVPALFFGAFLEGLLLIGSYFPGVFVIFLGVLVADSSGDAIFAVFISTLGLVLAHISNYFLGKYGWYKLLTKLGMKDAIEQSKIKLEKRGLWAIPLSYWLPSIGALTNTAVGILGIPFKKFIICSITSSIFWYSVVGFIVYRSGESALEVAGGGAGNIYVFLIMGVWIAGLILFDFLKRRHNK